MQKVKQTRTRTNATDATDATSCKAGGKIAPLAKGIA